jgi:hypothetical protein
MTSSLAAVLSAAGRANPTVAAVGVTADTVTLVGIANLDRMAEVPDNDSVWVDVAVMLSQTARTRGAAMTAGAAIQSFFTQVIMVAQRDEKQRC